MSAQTTQRILDELTPVLQQIDEAADREYAKWFDQKDLSSPDGWAKMQEAARRANEAVPEPLRRRAAELLPALCDAYLAETPQQRRETRDRVRDAKTLHHHLIGLIHVTARQIGERRQEIAPAVQRALAAAAIENNVLDFRDMYIALGELYKAAWRAGFDPTPAFEEVAALSDDQSAYPDSNQQPMNLFLRDFTKSAFFAADVETQL